MTTSPLNTGRTPKTGPQPSALFGIQLTQQIRIQLPRRSSRPPSQRTAMRSEIDELPTPVSSPTYPIHSPDVLQLVDHVDDDTRRHTKPIGKIELSLGPIP